MDAIQEQLNVHSSLNIGPSMSSDPSLSLQHLLSIPVTSSVANQQSFENTSIMTPKIRLCDLSVYVELQPESEERYEMVRIDGNTAFREPLEVLLCAHSCLLID